MKFLGCWCEVVRGSENILACWYSPASALPGCCYAVDLQLLGIRITFWHDAILLLVRFSVIVCLSAQIYQDNFVTKALMS